jgi:hypothetical protein
MSVKEDTPKAAPEGREANGRFAKGNHGGPGNPFARRVAHLRSLALEVVSDDDLSAILRKMVELAKEGDVAAAKVVLQYTLGKPTEQPHPDRIDRDELEAFRANALHPSDDPVFASTPLAAPLIVARELVPAKGKAFADGLADGLTAQKQQERASVTKRGKPAEPTPVSAAGGQAGAAPPVSRPDSKRPQSDRRAANDRRS